MADFARRAALVLVATLLVAASADPVPTPPTSFHTVLDDKQLMNYVLDPAADVIWGAAGTISTLEGEQSLAPTTQEEWDAVRNAAAVVMESANLLSLPARARDRPDWIGIAGRLVDVGNRIRLAAEAKDETAVFNEGGELYVVCTSCHERYMTTTE